MSAAELVSFALENGGESLPPFTLDYVDYSSALTVLPSIRNLAQQISVKDFVGKMLNYPTHAAAEILLKLNHAVLDDAQLVVTVELWKRSIVENYEATERILQVDLDLQTLVPETLRTHLGEEPVSNAAWLVSVKEVGLAIDRIQTHPNSIECLVRLALANPELALAVFQERVDVAARALVSIIQEGQDWFVRSSELLNLFARLTSRQLKIFTG
jgi:hypothetical protein